MRASLLRLGRDLGIILGIVWIATVASGILGDLGPGFDAHAYWLTRSGDIYGHAQVGTPDAYLYSPAFAQVISPLTALPWPAFITLWSALIIVAYLWLTGPLAVPLLIAFPVVFEIHEANIHILLAAMLVLAQRWPGAWAFGLLTKVTPGVGLLWYAARREWRALGIALGVTAAISALSFALAPDAWRTWLALLVESTGTAPTTPYLPIPLAFRLPVAAVLVVWGALTDRRWVVPVAVTIALPIVWLNSLTVLLALVPELRRRFDLRVSPVARRRKGQLAPVGTGLPGTS